MLFNYFTILIVLLLISGLALDAGLLEWRQLQIQSAADAAALEGMYQYARSDSQWASEATSQAAANGYANGANNVTVSIVNPPPNGTFGGNSLAVQATVSQRVSNIFMGLVNGGKSTVAASSVAVEIPTCIWILNPNSSSSGSLWLASAGVYANCGAFVNTSNGSSLFVDSFANLNTFRNRVVGAASTGASSAGVINPPTKYLAATKNDPLAYITAPASPTPSSCTYSNVSLSSVTTTLSPGTYCGITITSSTVTMQPGLYIIAGGMSVYNSNIYGTGGVTFYLTKTTTATSYSNVTVTSNNYSNTRWTTSSPYGLYLKAPTNSLNGGIPGILVFADRNWATHGSQGVQISQVWVQADGYWYLSNTGLRLAQVPFYNYNYNGLVVDNLYYYGAAAFFTSNFSAFGGVSPIHYEDGVLQ